MLIAEYVGICGVLLCFFSFVSWMVIMSGCSSVTRSFNSSCLFVMLLIFSCRNVKSFWLGCDVVACECVVELSVVVWVVRAEGGSLRVWGPGLLSTSPLWVWVVPATLRVPVAGWPKKRELGPLSSGQGKSMQFVDPDRIEQSDHVQAASFAPSSTICFSCWAPPIQGNAPHPSPTSHKQVTTPCLISLFHWRSTTSLTTLPTLPDARSHLLPLIWVQIPTNLPF